MSSIFTKIIQGEIPCEKIYETANEFAFLDILPMTEGHTLVVTKREIARFEDLTEEESVSLIKTLQKVSLAVSKCYGNADYNLIVNNGAKAGQEVPHVHFHIVARPNGIENKERVKYPIGQMEKVGAMIRKHLETD